jgi:alpha-beta hydrolase superfamily lysophospholipase
MQKQAITLSWDGENTAGVLFKPDLSSPAPAPALVICHGAFEYKENFFELAAFLADHGICGFAIDMPGHGKSSGHRFHIDLDLWVRAVRSAVDRLTQDPDIGADRIGLFGFSSGGTAVLETVLADSRINALITLDATVRNYLGWWDTLVFRVITALGAAKKRVTGKDLRINILAELKKATVAHDPAVNEAITNDPAIVAAYCNFPLPGASATAFVNTLQRVNRISAPTLVLHGTEDRVDPPETGQVLFDALGL